MLKEGYFLEKKITNNRKGPGLAARGADVKVAGGRGIEERPERLRATSSLVRPAGGPLLRGLVQKWRMKV